MQPRPTGSLAPRLRHTNKKPSCGPCRTDPSCRSSPSSWALFLALLCWAPCCVVAFAPQPPLPHHTTYRSGHMHAGALEAPLQGASFHGTFPTLRARRSTRAGAIHAFGLAGAWPKAGVPAPGTRLRCSLASPHTIQPGPGGSDPATQAVKGCTQAIDAALRTTQAAAQAIDVDAHSIGGALRAIEAAPQAIEVGARAMEGNLQACETGAGGRAAALCAIPSGHRALEVRRVTVVAAQTRCGAGSLCGRARKPGKARHHCLRERRHTVRSAACTGYSHTVVWPGPDRGPPPAHHTAHLSAPNAGTGSAGERHALAGVHMKKVPAFQWTEHDMLTNSFRKCQR